MLFDLAWFSNRKMSFHWNLSRSTICPGHSGLRTVQCPVFFAISGLSLATHCTRFNAGITITPLELSDPRLTKQEFVQSQPRIVERRSVAPAAPTAVPKKKRSLEKEVLIVGGSAGAGAAIGAVAGGGKGAGIGALSGGVAGLVYDLATKNKK